MDHWQDLVVVGLVAVAVVYLGRIYWIRLFRRAGSSCDTCLGCPSRGERTPSGFPGEIGLIGSPAKSGKGASKAARPGR
ncbi:MAG: hypothetical protein ACYC6Y_22785 [Thermoguttaceae bacterium]